MDSSYLQRIFLKISAATAKGLERDACSCQYSQVQQQEGISPLPTGES